MPPEEGLKMYQHDLDLTASFASDNPETVAQARQKLMICTILYRCENFHIFFPGKHLGETFPCPVCGTVVRPEGRMASTPVYRFRCPKCGGRLSWPRKSHKGQGFAAGTPVHCWLSPLVILKEG